MKFSAKAAIALGLASICTLSSAAIIQGATVIYNSSPTIWSANNLVNQSGLSIGYTSGVTRFEDYAAANPGHMHSSGPNGFMPGLGEAYVDFDFGQQFTFEKLGLFNDNDTQGVDAFRVSVSQEVTFANEAAAGAFNASYGPFDYSLPIHMQVFNLAPQTGRYVRVYFDSEHYSNWGPGINVGELVFGVKEATANPVPEPSGLLLFGLAAAGLAVSRRKKAK